MLPGSILIFPESIVSICKYLLLYLKVSNENHRRLGIFNFRKGKQL